MLHAKAKKKTAITAHRTTLHTIAAKHTHITSNTFSLTHTHTLTRITIYTNTLHTAHKDKVASPKTHNNKHTTTKKQLSFESHSIPLEISHLLFSNERDATY